MLRRYHDMHRSVGTRIPNALRMEVLAADGGCVGQKVGMEHTCYGALELDHVQASHGIGMKSPTVRGNLVSLCSIAHRTKTEYGRVWRPKLVAYIAKRDADIIE